ARVEVAGELLQGDQTVAVGVHQLDRLGRRLVGDVVAERAHQPDQLGRRDLAVPVGVEDPEAVRVVVGVGHADGVPNAPPARTGQLARLTTKLTLAPMISAPNRYER